MCTYGAQAAWTSNKKWDLSPTAPILQCVQRRYGEPAAAGAAQPCWEACSTLSRNGGHGALAMLPREGSVSGISCKATMSISYSRDT